MKSSEGFIDMKLVNPAENTEDKGANPEHFFAAGYAACFDGAVNLIASKQRKQIESSTDTEVSFMKDEADGGNKIGVTLNIKIKGVNPEDARDLVEKAHKICPYSKATRGNIEVKINSQAIE